MVTLFQGIGSRPRQGQFPADFPLIITGSVTGGAMSEKRNISFPSKTYKGIQQHIYHQNKLTVEQLQDALFENYYGHLKDDIGEGIATAPVLWWLQFPLT